MNLTPHNDLPVSLEERQHELFLALTGQLKARIKKSEKLLKNLRQDYQQFLDILDREHDAELLKSHLHAIKRGKDAISVMDYFQDPPSLRTIALDVKRSPQENLNHLFKLIKRARRGLVQLGPRINEVEQALIALKNELADVQEKGPEHINPDDQSVKIIKAKKTKQPRLPYRQFQSRENIPIWVGRSAKDNDELLKHFSRGNEWWLHAKETPGSHVIIKTSIDAISLPTLLDAAHLAAHFCKIKEHSLEVIYTRVKYVRKIKGMPAGKVSVLQQKSLLIKKDTDLLQQLLQSEIKHGD